ncbi:MAG TPA: RagB/SusD family nutrient uptake outer membrane protein [Chitinophaga sp.]|uniref:RagB/SusD family nutrient uptake outer membrane protein n=1 Tax=Chitinophaga sp. TaxID=1869181 RepID=UPI002DB8FB40|nr:RagB/SusD family nutrient uptake outer membrane protein [Chitinophaga sp.]HEU4554893.1 RagB/SusD family nutrient uptake outer membrane protein [Chitinophaga sp.]
MQQLCKPYKKIALIAGSCILLFSHLQCSDSFLDKQPLSLDQTALANKKGVNAILIGAYSLLDGIGAGGSYEQTASNWSFGSIRGGDAHKGADPSSQPDINNIERYESNPTDNYYLGKWRTVYEGVLRANNTLKVLRLAQDMTEDEKLNVTAQARFLRGFYHFEAKKLWNNVPYLGDSITDLNPKIPNDRDIWPEITADLRFAADNLPETQDMIGRVNKWAATAFLAKAYMYQRKFAEAKPLIEAVLTNGKNSRGVKYQLNACFHDNFNPATKNSPEAILEAQTSVNDGAGGANGNHGDMLNYPYTGGPGKCCGTFQPSQDLVNSYKTDVNGLPLLTTYNNEDVKNDEGIASDQQFTPYTGQLDPRLDWTVGRRGIPYLDWGPHPGAAWIRNQSYAGPYSPKKNVYYKEQQGKFSDASSPTSVANNVKLLRLAEVILWAAECEAEIGDPDKARTYVNMLRARARNGCYVQQPDGTPAANYYVDVYKTPWTSRDEALRAIRFENKLELAMEGHRFFDLVRWGVADTELNAYLAAESTKRVYLKGATFTKGVDEYYPIPQTEIQNSYVNGQPTLQQNPGYH